MYAMKLYDASGEIHLSGPLRAAGLTGAQYLPASGTPAAAEADEWVTEEALCGLAPGAAGRAALEQLARLNGAVWAAIQVEGAAGWLRSPAADLTATPGAALPGGRTLRLRWRRRLAWEGEEMELALSNRSGQSVTGGVLVNAQHDAGRDAAAWVEAGALGGQFATPARLELVNDGASGASFDQAWVGLAAGAAAGFDPVLEGEAGEPGAGVLSASLASPAASGGAFRRVSWSGAEERLLARWELTSERLAGWGARALLPLLRLAAPAPTQAVYVWARAARAGATLAVGAPELCQPGRWQHALPAWQLSPAEEALPAPATLELWACAPGGGATELDLDGLWMLPQEGRRWLRAPGWLEAGWRMIDAPPQAGRALDGQQRFAWSVTAPGPGLSLRPGIRQRLFVAWEGPGWASPSAALRLRVFARPRWCWI